MNKKQISDKKSIELFDKDNETHYHELISAYNDYIREYYSIGDIRPLMRQDVTSPYFVKWLFKTDEFSDDEPEKFDFNILIDDPERGNHVYGYYVNNLEGIIRIRDNKTFKSISMLFVNPESEGNGIGQTLLRYAIKKYGDDDLKLNVFAFNKRAIHIYEKHRFKITDTHTVQEEPGESDKFVGKKMHAMTRYPSKNGIRPLGKKGCYQPNFFE